MAPELSARFQDGSEDIDRGNAVDREFTAAVKQNVWPQDPAALACIDWVQRHLGGYELRAQAPVALLDPETGDVITQGTPDLTARGERETVIVDLKKAEQYYAGMLDHPDSNDQLDAYGLAAALEHGSDSYRKVILLFGERDVEPLESRPVPASGWQAKIDDFKARMARPLTYTVGDHCGACWSKSRCPAHMLPAYHATAEMEAGSPPQALAPIMEGGGGLQSEEQAAKALLVLMAMEKLCDRKESPAWEQVRDFARRNGGRIRVGDRQFCVSQMPGRKGIDQAALAADGLLEKYTRAGAPYEQWSLRKASK
jgi:PD-(D/E)XK nuclease superfamily protein